MGGFGARKFGRLSDGDFVADGTRGGMMGGGIMGGAIAGGTFAEGTSGGGTTGGTTARGAGFGAFAKVAIGGAIGAGFGGACSFAAGTAGIGDNGTDKGDAL